MQRRTFLTGAGVAAAAANVAYSARAAPPPEPIIDPDRPIIDPHHHLWDKPGRHYMFPELLADLASGHNITQTVFLECGSMYRAGGPEALQSLGETEFANGVAAMSDSGGYGKTRVAAGIVSYVDLRLGDGARAVLERHVAAAGGRCKGVRNRLDWDPNPLFGRAYDPTKQGVMVSDAFRKGFAALKPLGLSYDALCLHPQLPDVIDLARRFPDTPIILNHMGAPVRVGPYATHPDETYRAWRASLAELARSPNVLVKLGGIGMNTFGSPSFNRQPPSDSATMAAEAKPFIDACIEIFGPSRCMFESDYPVDNAMGAYSAIWNVLKRVAAPYSETEKTAMFSDVAARAYRLSA
jgi:predicted TIM-barrel fold metal-dependent hydrolase